MSNQEIILFDLPSRPPNKAWSLNPWKARFVLNYKGLPYKTEWVEYPDIKPRFKDHLPADHKEYTIPAIILPGGEFVIDSWKIADVLEEKYPEPSIHLDSPYLPKVKELVAGAIGNIRGIFVPGVHKILNEPSQVYFRRTREEAVGMTLEKLSEERGGEKAWKAAQPYFENVTALLKENTEGPFFDGKTVGFADFVWGGALLFLRSISEEVLQEGIKVGGDPEPHLKLLEALKPWWERDNY